MMKKLRMSVAAIITLAVIGGVPVFAQSPSPSTTVSPSPSTTITPTPSTKAPDTPGKCGSTKTHLIACSDDTGIGAISDLIKLAISVLTVLIGLVAVGGLAYAAIVYASARDDRDKVSDAMGIIRNIVIGLVLYGFTIAIINWLIPGGVIG